MKYINFALLVSSLILSQAGTINDQVVDNVGILHFDRFSSGSPRRLMGSNTLSSSDKLQILNLHNTERGNTALGKTKVNQPMATDMTQMIWSSTLGSVASSYAAKCVWGHSQNGYGENLFVSFSNSASIESINTLLSGIESWYNESKYYTYSSNNCASQQQCGHYTQVVWADSTSIGCGYAVCDPYAMMGYSYKYAVYLVCNYDPPGNYVGEKPYTQATSSAAIATSCPSGYTGSQSTGLCMRNDGSTGIDTSGTTTTSNPGTTTTKAGATTTTKVGTTTTKAATTTSSSSSSCTTCSVKWRVAYTSSSWSTVAQLVWNNALTVVQSQTTKGYSISGSYSSAYFDISVTTYSNSDAVTLQSYVSGNTYKSQLSSQISSYITAGSLVITVQAITTATNSGQAYNSDGSSSSSDNKTSVEWWVWLVAIAIGLVIGFICGAAFVHFKNKQQEKKQQSYVKMVDFVAQ